MPIFQLPLRDITILVQNISLLYCISDRNVNQAKDIWRPSQRRKTEATDVARSRPKH